jgi:hypothetical protein
LKQENLDLQGQAKRLTAIEEQQRVMISDQKGQIAEQASEISALKDLASEVVVLKRAVATMQAKENGAIQTAALGR